MNHIPLIIIKENSFLNAWARLVNDTMKYGIVMPTEYGQEAKFVSSNIELYGHAIEEIKQMKLHPSFPTKKSHLKAYLKQFTSSFDVEKHGFKYTYYQRLTESFNQLEYIKEKLKIVGSRRCQATTWIPEIDSKDDEPPCLQLIQLINLDGKHVSIHLFWRSRDILNAWMSNLIGIMYMLKDIIKDFKVVQIIENCSASHIYQSDWNIASKIKTVSINPQLQYR